MNISNQIEHLLPISEDDFPDFADWESPEFKIEGRGKDSFWRRIEGGSQGRGDRERGQKKSLYYLLSHSHKKFQKVSTLVLQIVANLR